MKVEDFDTTNTNNTDAVEATTYTTMATCHSDRPVKAKGLCSSCYNRQNNVAKNDRVRFGRLIKAGQLVELVRVEKHIIKPSVVDCPSCGGTTFARNIAWQPLFDDFGKQIPCINCDATGKSPPPYKEATKTRLLLENGTVLKKDIFINKNGSRTPDVWGTLGKFKMLGDEEFNINRFVKYYGEGNYKRVKVSNGSIFTFIEERENAKHKGSEIQTCRLF